MFDNGYGTSQSVIDGLLRATNMLLAGKTVVVAGYGSCGRAIAERARGLGAHVIVTEVDPVRALDAIMRGYRVLPMAAAAPAGRRVHHRDRIARRDRRPAPGGHARRRRAGQCRALRRGDRRARAGRAGAVEINRGVRPNADEYVLDSGRRLILLAEGRVVNLIAAEGNPAAVMDLSFAAQALALTWLAGAVSAKNPASPDSAGGKLPPGVYEVPVAIDAEAARLVLAAAGTTIDALTPVQQAYLESWRSGS